MRAVGQSRKMRIGLGLMGVPLAGALWFLTHPPLDSLLAHAHRVGIKTDQDDSFWMSGHEFFAISSSGARGLQGILYDLTTGTHRRAEYPVKMATNSASQFDASYSSSPAPDVLATYGETRYITPNRAHDDPACAALYTAQTIAPGNSIRVTTWDKYAIDRALAKRKVVQLEGIDFGGITGFVKVANRPATSGESATRLQPIHAFIMRLPPGAPSAAPILFSPQGDRWAVALSGWNIPKAPFWLRWLFPNWGRKYNTTLYTGSTSDGVTHLLGSVRTTPESSNAPIPSSESAWRLMSSLQWMPDDRHLSFVYKNSLYTIAAR